VSRRSKVGLLGKKRGKRELRARCLVLNADASEASVAAGMGDLANPYISTALLMQVEHLSFLLLHCRGSWKGVMRVDGDCGCAAQSHSHDFSSPGFPPTSLGHWAGPSEHGCRGCKGLSMANRCGGCRSSRKVDDRIEE